MSVPVRLTRSMLFVPASRPEMIAKAAASEADAVCIYLEDSVVPNEKAASRQHVVRALQEVDFGRRVRMVRINALDTSFTYRDLVEVIEGAGDRVDVVMVPKVGAAADVAFVDRLLSQIEAHRGFTHKIGIEAQIESAQGFLHERESECGWPRVEASICEAGAVEAAVRRTCSSIGRT